METLDLERIRNGFPGITPTLGKSLLEACLVCLEKLDHTPGAVLNVFGDWNVDVELQWTTVVSEQMRRTWASQNETTELAAICIIALLVERWTDYTIIGKAGENTGIDYWLGNKISLDCDDTYFPSARLDISGIFSGTLPQIRQRLKLKITQAQQSEATKLPLIIGIAEFGKPRARLEKKQ